LHGQWLGRAVVVVAVEGQRYAAGVSTIGRKKAEMLGDRLDDLEAQWPSWRWLRVRLTSAGLTPSSAWPVQPREPRSSWLIMALASDALRLHFELAPEVLILVSPFKELQAQSFQAVEEVFRKELRLDPGFAIVVTHDTDGERRLSSILPKERRFVFISDEELELVPDPQLFLRTRLRDALGARRLFDHRRPAAGPQFFGRERELEALERDVRSGHCLGLFGLRKVGKTSLMSRLTEKFRSFTQDGPRVLPVMVDLLTLPYNQRGLRGVLELICSRAEETLYPNGTTDFRLPPDPQDRFVTLVKWAATYQDRVLLLLDEYEVLLGRVPVSDGLAVLDWLRGLAQAHPDAFSLVLAGRNARLLSPARIDGADNPMYRFLRSFPITGLDPEECRTMVKKLGARMGLKFKYEVLEKMVAVTGGHPALVRTLGDLMDQRIPTSERNPTMVDLRILNEVLPRFAREVDEDMRELVEASVDIAPDALEFLRHRAYGMNWIGGQAEGRIVDALAGYGILQEGTGQLRIGQLGTWLHENYQPPARSAHG
jgi:hypothetical protein